MKYTLHCQITCDSSGAGLVVLNGLPAYHDVTMTPQQLKALAEKLNNLAETAERGGVGEIEQEYSVSDYSKTKLAIDGD